MSKLPSIALSGWMRSGKDSIADHLHEKYGYLRASFGDILKTEVATAVGATLEEMNEEPLRTQIRPVLQAWGTDFRRAQDDNYWVKQAALGMARDSRIPDQPVVFTDCRFVNELSMLHALGFVTVKVDMAEETVRDYLAKQGRGPVEIDKLLDHPSEREWQDYIFDATVRSVMGELEQLYSQVDNIVEVRSNG